MADRAPWHASRPRRLAATLIPLLATPLVRALARTWRIEVDGQMHLDALDHANRRYVLAVWHGRILPGLAWLRDEGLVALASENFDGEWIARVLERFGFTMIRGSSSRGGVRALVQLAAALRAGRSAVITVDGPRGPAGVAQPGAVWVAWRAAAPVVPFHVEADRSWTLGSWDRGLVPKPFARLVVCVGEPLWCAAGDDAAVESGRLALELALRSCEERALRLARRPGAS